MSREGELLDLGVDHGIVDKSGAWYAYGSERLGQGKENVRQFLGETPELRQQIEDKLLVHLGMKEDPDANVGEKVDEQGPTE